jgi:hypothetical protein
MAAKWQPTKQQRDMIRIMKAGGLTNIDIAGVLGVTEKTLVKACADEIKSGKSDVDSRIIGSLVKNALAGNVTAQIFYLKTRCGWREVQEVEHSGKRPVIVYEEIPKGAGRKPKQPSS